MRIGKALGVGCDEEDERCCCVVLTNRRSLQRLSPALGSDSGLQLAHGGSKINNLMVSKSGTPLKQRTRAAVGATVALPNRRSCSVGKYNSKTCTALRLVRPTLVHASPRSASLRLLHPPQGPLHGRPRWRRRMASARSGHHSEGSSRSATAVTAATTAVACRQRPARHRR